MLGWGVRVYQDTEDRDEFVAGWTADAWFLSTIHEMIENGQAQAVSLSGGYPNWYSIDTDALVPLMEGDASELQIKPNWDGQAWKRQVFWKTGPLKITTEKLLVEIWDQS